MNFYFAYVGNKRVDYKHIEKYIHLENIKVVIEPCCGTCAISYNIWQKNKNMKFILNDNDKQLINFITYIREHKQDAINELNKYMDMIGIPSEDEYKKLIKEDTLFAYYVKCKYYNFRIGIYPKNNTETIFKRRLDYKYDTINDFFMNADIEFSCDEGINIIEKYKNRPDCMIYIDPPYIISETKFYNDNSMNVYKYLYEAKIKQCDAVIYIHIEKNWILSLLFSDLFCIEFDKTYNNINKRKTTLVLMSNKKML